jgi:hypothetical protein
LDPDPLGRGTNPHRNVTDLQHYFQEMLKNWSLDYVPVRSLVISFVTKLEKTFTRWASGPEVVLVVVSNTRKGLFVNHYMLTIAEVLGAVSQIIENN